LLCAAPAAPPAAPPACEALSEADALHALHAAAARVLHALPPQLQARAAIAMPLLRARTLTR
jgi:hypothetical protein